MKEAICVRPATAEDAEQLLEIYTPFVISEDSSLSNVSFELEAPDVEEFRHSASRPFRQTMLPVRDNPISGVCSL